MTGPDDAGSPRGAADPPPGGLRRIREWPMLVVLALGVASLGVLAGGYFRAGSVLLAATVVLAMFLRLMLRTDEAGLLVVRSKALDAACLGTLGVGLALLAFLVPEAID